MRRIDVHNRMTRVLRKTGMSGTRHVRCVSILAFGMIAALFLGSVCLHAEETAEETTYTIRILAGDKGTMADIPSCSNGTAVIRNTGAMVTYEGLKPGDTISFSPDDVGLKSEYQKKYYVKAGLRESGKDYEDDVHPPVTAITVTKDMDYVVSYGVSGKTVSCTVRYVDQNGKQQADPETFYGKVGEQLVVGARYVEGYTVVQVQREGYSPVKGAKTAPIMLNAQKNAVTFTYAKKVTPTQTTQPASGR